MPSKLRRLKKSAMESCIFRGHKMNKFRGSVWSTKHNSLCTECLMRVTVNLNPAPNDIEIGGEAVALNCRGPQED
jgi:hypothetical protein